jgi:sigma-B regulation protein RsbU (phosphoserine phosphatase)
MLRLNAGNPTVLPPPLLVSPSGAGPEWPALPRVARVLEKSDEGAGGEAGEMLRELDAARNVQRSWVQRTFPPLPGFELSAYHRSPGHLSGDVCEVLPMGNGKALLAVADVMGRGAPAALVAASFRVLLRTFAKSMTSPAALVRELNSQLWDDLEAAEMFVTLQLVLADTKRATLTFANAGHCPALLADAPGLGGTDNGAPVRMSSVAPEGLPLGIVPKPEFEESVIPLRASSCLMLYTDGLSETAGRDGTLFGQMKLANCLKQNFGHKASELTADVLAELELFQSPALPRDDLTLLVLASVGTERSEVRLPDVEAAGQRYQAVAHNGK